MVADLRARASPEPGERRVIAIGVRRDGGRA